MTVEQVDVLALVRDYGEYIDRAVRSQPGSTERPDGTRRYETYCVRCNRDYKRDFMRRKLNITIKEHTPKLDADTLTLVSSDPLWQEWLALPPRVELERQHELAVQLQRKYRCDYKQLAHSMRACWCDHWESILGHAPYMLEAG